MQLFGVISNVVLKTLSSLQTRIICGVVGTVFNHILNSNLRNGHPEKLVVKSSLLHKLELPKHILRKVKHIKRFASGLGKSLLCISATLR